MDACDPAGVATISRQWYEAGLGLRLAVADGGGNLCDDPHRLRVGPSAALWTRTHCHGSSDRHHAGDRVDRTGGGQAPVLALGALSARTLGHRVATSLSVRLSVPAVGTLILPSSRQGHLTRSLCGNSAELLCLGND